MRKLLAVLVLIIAAVVAIKLIAALVVGVLKLVVWAVVIGLVALAVMWAWPIVRGRGDQSRS